MAPPRLQVPWRRPSLPAAAAGASVVVLQKFFPLDSAAIHADLDAQRAEPPAKAKHFAAGERIGREIGAEVLAFAATDNFGVLNPGTPPIGPGYWTSRGASIVRSGFGARPFFLASNKEVILPADPANITTPLGLPNHPSYPSAHSCGSGAWAAILINAFPSEREILTAMRQEAADSRVYPGLHYVFDNDAGIALGDQVAQLALSRDWLK